MRDVAAFAGFAEAVTFDGLGKNHGRLSFVFGGGFVGGVNFPRIVPAAIHLAQLLVREMVYELEQLGIFPEEVAADVTAGLDGIFLEFAVDRFLHALEQKAGVVAREEFVPIGPPNDFDHVPAGTAKNAFEFLDDFAVAPDGTVESLEIAIDDPDEIVELLASGECELPEGLGLVGFAIADEAPHARLFFPIHKLARLEVTIKPRLVK